VGRDADAVRSHQTTTIGDLCLGGFPKSAAPDGTPGASGLSGLTRAFVYAGARSLLVSHWAVYSAAAERLTTGMFAELAREPGLGSAEALRRAMLALIDGGGRLAHPAAWAPFVVIGEGGAAARRAGRSVRSAKPENRRTGPHPPTPKRSRV
jgi:hypothetical protein